MTVVRAGHTARRAVENQGHRSVDRSGRRWMVCRLTRLVHRSAKLSTEPSPDVGRVAPRGRVDCPQGCAQVYPRFSVTQATWVRPFVMFLAVWTEPAQPQKTRDPAVPAEIRPGFDPVDTPPRAAIRRRRRRCGGQSTAAIKSATRAGRPNFSAPGDGWGCCPCETEPAAFGRPETHGRDEPTAPGAHSTSRGGRARSTPARRTTGGPGVLPLRKSPPGALYCPGGQSDAAAIKRCDSANAMTDHPRSGLTAPGPG
ncbi:hypothetical protein SAMN04487818_11911 [Actinokineospora terrae]|uniref:Uncharacterized protein n=1 Tax=Actinokineospora terrae TaxID=155974 RepID=A0A1H9XR06_9PSEU|nr:hypothetical protein SAMN04487818_11911 [Actinokineospora terrae]